MWLTIGTPTETNPDRRHRDPSARRQVDDVAARVPVPFVFDRVSFDGPDHLLVVPLSVQLQHGIDGELGRLRNLQVKVLVLRRGPAARSRGMVVAGVGVRHRDAGPGYGRGGRRPEHPIGQRRVVLEPIAEVGVLRTLAGEGVEDVGAERPRLAEPLRQREPGQRVPGAGAGLELGLEQRALAVVDLGAAGLSNVTRGLMLS